MDDHEKLREAIEIIKRLMRYGGRCEVCYEDSCAPWTCDCKCHDREREVREKARAFLQREEYVGSPD